MYPGKLCDVPGIRLGHAQDSDALTGVTVLLSDQPMTCGVDVRGSAPGTRETDLLKSENLVSEVNAVALCGGSAFGLDAVSGVVKYLEEQGLGMDTGFYKVPIVPGAVIFDLAIGRADVHPDFAMGYQACTAIDNDRQGLVGAGMGATVGKALGNAHAVKSGLGQASLQAGELIVSSLTVLNAFGDIYDSERHRQIAGVHDKGHFLDTVDILKEKAKEGYDAFKGRNTTLSIVATNGKLSKVQLNKVAQMAHDGYARGIDPVHTMFDGDTIFAVATGDVVCDNTLVGVLAARCIARSIANAIYAAQSAGGVQSYHEL
ncbi:P1 family peptidase [Peptoniphilus equinus]|uniref:P1 family peptidase n=1 Tax=Peptoniphilus equinus TaxID=3016343 RepID=A0ABY7QWZ5_9FIRM|nr:P1 family peptidase [Peptoniphilus equinus]WBW50790.1 P1 family peptidase [Peptoniphilus equinus]